MNHIAITMPTREAWLAHLAYLQEKGVKFDRRVEHGMTHSLYIHDPNGYGVEFVYDLPKEVWKDDINGALNYVKVLPTEGAEALDDRTQGIPTFKTSPGAGEVTSLGDRQQLLAAGHHPSTRGPALTPVRQTLNVLIIAPPIKGVRGWKRHHATLVCGRSTLAPVLGRPPCTYIKSLTEVGPRHADGRA